MSLKQGGVFFNSDHFIGHVVLHQDLFSQTRVFFQNKAQQIRIGEDTHHLAIFQNRQGSDLVFQHNAGSFGDHRFRADGERILGHHIANGLIG
ncbi:hypothetical protein SDC9_154457 [bioreactor metagenome]|uniref:Uncharacterized protein n=1 Tax=bioreactor metagenome TaxID=1076179 RepID=A0A645EYT3_9ZZZZ